VPWFWVLIYDLSLFENAAEGARTLSLGVGLFCALLTIIPAVYCATQSVDTDALKPINKDTLKQCFSDIYLSIKEVFRIPAFVRICGATFFVFNAFNTVAGFSWFIIVYLMNGGDAGAAGTWPAWFGTLSALSTCFLVIPIVTAMSSRWGKKNTFMICQSISLAGYVLFYWCFDPSNPLLMFIPLPLFAFGIGSLFTIMMSMTADICDLDDLTNGVRREGVLGAIFWWMVKFGFAIAGLLSGLILSMIGFDQSISAQPSDVLESLKLSYIIVPSIGTIIAMFIMSGYDLDEDKANQVRVKLEARKLG
jgi:GPH family glycoside/pentoside/hexuronide:cation symporter